MFDLEICYLNLIDYYKEDFDFEDNLNLMDLYYLDFVNYLDINFVGHLDLICYLMMNNYLDNLDLFDLN